MDDFSAIKAEDFHPSPATMALLAPMLVETSRMIVNEDPSTFSTLSDFRERVLRSLAEG